VSGLCRRLAIIRHALNMLLARKLLLRQRLKQMAMPPIINGRWLSVRMTGRCRQKLRKNRTIISSFAIGLHRPRSVGCSPLIAVQPQKSICSLTLGEHAFRHNRRKTKGVGRLVARCLENMIAKPPLTSRQLIRDTIPVARSKELSIEPD